MRSLVMNDVETGSEWSHLLGRSMAGKLKGRVLRPIVSDMLTWSAWRKEFPETTVLDMSRTSQNYTRQFYEEPKRFVLGFEVQGASFALPMDKLMEQPVHMFKAGDEMLLATFDADAAVVRLFDPDIDGQRLDFAQISDHTMQDRQTETVWDLATGKAKAGRLAGKHLRQRVGIMSFRRAWDNFHPDSTDIQF